MTSSPSSVWATQVRDHRADDGDVHAHGNR
jgi:hypothetical protein